MIAKSKINESEAKKLKFPWFTTLITVSCLVIFSLWYYQSLHDVQLANIYSKIGAPHAFQIYQGQYWGVFTNSFIHINVIHMSFNLVGLWLFSAYLERRISFIRLFFLGFFASVITSVIQLMLTDDAGVGLSGVNFALFGFILGKSLRNEKFRLRFRLIYLTIVAGVLIVSVYLNEQKSYQIGVEAMGSGLLIGFLIGLLSELKKKVYLIISIVVLMTGGIYSLIKAPWSAEWNCFKGYEYHLKYDFKNAKKYYRNALEIDPKHVASRSNLFIIKVDELSDLALNAHEKGDYLKARVYYERLLKINPNNSWAKENIAKLP